MQENFMQQITQLPDSLQRSALYFITQWVEKLPPQTQTLLDQPLFINSFARVVSCSQFVSQSCLRNPQLLVDLLETGDLFSNQNRQTYSQAIQPDLIDSESGLMKQLRVFRNREMVRIAWRDLAGWADLYETLHDLTALAEFCIQKTLDYLYQQACDRWGTPCLDNGKPINMVILGMGKLGAWELNYSSDIDLIFAYPQNGELNDRKSTSYGEFFTRICRSLIKILDETTVDGFVFRTDVRLRPFGDSGPLIMTFDGMEHYYTMQAREWERYAMIKARPVAGDFDSGQQLMAMIKSFVYRRYLDYGAFEELRTLKAMITCELMRQDRLNNIKLGTGGIREIEFIGQAFQLIRGGQDISLQQREILVILQRLGEQGLLTTKDAKQLQNAYRFLRRVENHIQQYQDRQTHELPNDELIRQILAFSLNFADWDTFKAKLDETRQGVQTIFDQVFSLSEQENIENRSKLIWLGEDHKIINYLRQQGFNSPDQSMLQIKQFKMTASIKRLSNKGRDVMARLIPQLVDSLATVDNPDETLRRILSLFEKVAGRNVYLSLLAENPKALAQLVKLSSASLWICQYLARYPVLFDELLDTRTLYEPLKPERLKTELVSLLAKIDPQDIEQFMIVLRQFKHLNTLRIAAADIMQLIPLMVVSDYLTYVAEVILAQVVDKCWDLLVAKHGKPNNAGANNKGFAILGFGKLGGYELGYGSDLDLVFLYDSEDIHADTQGSGKSVSCSQFYLRLGQKVRHILDTNMLAGVLYQVDLRLRPNGDSGLLVTRIKTYQDYLQQNAWTWEHQALVRGRFIVGDLQLKQSFDAIRYRVLSSVREICCLKGEILTMRDKMRQNLDQTNAQQFDLKHGSGGIVDIEFIVQFLILAHASENKTLTYNTDNIRLLQSLADAKIISTEQQQALEQAYCIYRNYGHHQTLQGKQTMAKAEDFVAIRSQVEDIWQQVFA